MKKLLVIGLVLVIAFTVVLSVLVAGCGKDDAKTTTTVDATATTVVDDATATTVVDDAAATTVVEEVTTTVAP